MQQQSVPESDGNFPIVITDIPPTAGQRRVAFGAIGLLLVGIAVAIPFAGVQAGPIDAFIPVIQTVMCFADLITASLLFAQYSIQRQHAILVLACGYICSGLFAFLQTLAFPGAYAPTGLIGDGTNTAAWFFILWHTTFPLAIIVYALSKRMDGIANVQDGLVRPMIGLAIGCVLAIVAVLTLIVTTWIAYLPGMYTGGVTQQTLAANLVNLFMWCIGVTALAAVFLRRRSILDLWLIVVLVAWMPNFLVATFFTVVRFSIGWYMARGSALIASCTVLILLLTQTTVLYARLATTLTLLRRERVNRLMSVDAATAAIAHEVRQPLTVISSCGEAALIWLNKVPLNLEEIKTCVEAMIEASRQSDNIISSIRGLIKTTSERMTTGINDVARQVLNLAGHDLLVQSVAVTTQYQDNLPEIHGDRTLLQQALLNLVRNAIEAMALVEPRARRLRLTTRLDGNSSVVISVEDSGCGVPAENRDRLFEPFFTSKSTGMGLGLSVCRTVVEDHGGELRLIKTDSRGSIFEIALPFDSPK